MPYVGDRFRIFYRAKGYCSGLTDVRMVVYKPDLTKQGVYTLTEVNGGGDGKGVYSCIYEDSDQPGAYLFVVNSASCPKRDDRQVFFEKKPEFQITDEIIRILKTQFKPGIFPEIRMSGRMIFTRRKENFFVKQPFEAHYVFGDFTDDLIENEVIESGIVTAFDKSGADVSDDILDSASKVVSGSDIKIRVRGGTPESSLYRISFRAMTTAGNQFEIDSTMKVKR